MLTAAYMLSFATGFCLSLGFLVRVVPGHGIDAQRIQDRMRGVSGPDVQGTRSSLRRRTRLSRFPALNRWLQRQPASYRLVALFEEAGLSTLIGEFLIFVCVCVIAAFLLLQPITHRPLFSLILAVLAGTLPLFYVLRKRRQRMERFAELLPDSLSLIANSLRAGQGFTAAMELVAEEMPEPVKKEFSRTLGELRLGIPLHDALRGMTLRVPTPDLHLFVNAVLLQREVGGNLAEFLNTLEQTIRDRFRIQRELVTMTSQARLSGKIVGVMPLFIVGILAVLNPDYLPVLIEDDIGHIFIFWGLLLQLIGVLTIRKMTRIEV